MIHPLPASFGEKDLLSFLARECCSRLEESEHEQGRGETSPFRRCDMQPGKIQPGRCHLDIKDRFRTQRRRSERRLLERGTFRD